MEIIQERFKKRDLTEGAKKEKKQNNNKMVEEQYDSELDDKEDWVPDEDESEEDQENFKVLFLAYYYRINRK